MQKVLERERDSLPTNPQNQPLGVKLCLAQVGELALSTRSLAPPVAAARPAPTGSSQGRPPYRPPTYCMPAALFQVTLTHQMGWREKCVCPPPPARAPVSSLSYNTGQPCPAPQAENVEEGLLSLDNPQNPHPA